MVYTKKCQCCISGPGLCEDPACTDCFKRSLMGTAFASRILPEFHAQARMLRASTKESIKVECPKCKHQYDLKPSTLNTNTTTYGCKFCSETHPELCKIECTICEQATVALSPYADRWSSKNEVAANTVSIRSSARHLFDCAKCKHTLSVAPAEIVLHGRIQCGYCQHIRFCDDLCSTCFPFTLASRPDLLANYEPRKKDPPPHKIGLNSGKKYKFKCPICKVVRKSVMYTQTAGSTCGCTKYKTMTMFANDFRAKYPDLELKREKCFDWCRRKKLLPFDYVVESLKLIIEIDGRQHFHDIPNWCDLDHVLAHDMYKMHCALAAGYTLLRVDQVKYLARAITIDHCDAPIRALGRLAEQTDKPPNFPRIVMLGEAYRDDSKHQALLIGCAASEEPIYMVTAIAVDFSCSTVPKTSANAARQNSDDQSPKKTKRALKPDPTGDTPLSTIADAEPAPEPKTRKKREPKTDKVKTPSDDCAPKPTSKKRSPKPKQPDHDSTASSDSSAPNTTRKKRSTKPPNQDLMTSSGIDAPNTTRKKRSPKPPPPTDSNGVPVAAPVPKTRQRKPKAVSSEKTETASTAESKTD